jgi:hypothetical protein
MTSFILSISSTSLVCPNLSHELPKYHSLFGLQKLMVCVWNSVCWRGGAVLEGFPNPTGSILAICLLIHITMDTSVSVSGYVCSVKFLPAFSLFSNHGSWTRHPIDLFGHNETTIA